jgi:hypothetical protein
MVDDACTSLHLYILYCMILYAFLHCKSMEHRTSTNCLAYSGRVAGVTSTSAQLPKV